MPYREKAEAQKHIDRDLWRRAGAVGLLCAIAMSEPGCGSDLKALRKGPSASATFATAQPVRSV